MNKLFKYQTFILFIVFIVLVVVYFRPLLIKTTEWYVGDLLKEEVKITSLTLYPITLNAYINNPNNRISGIVTNEFPLKAEVDYSGNVNAFKEYVPLDANTTLKALISYDTELVVETRGDVIIPAFDTLHLDTQLKMTDENLSVVLEAVFSTNSEYNFDANLSKEGNNTLVNLHSDAFGGESEAIYEDDKLKIKVKNIHLSKLLKQYKVDVNARGYISAEVAMDVKTLKSSLRIYSSKIRYEKETLRNVVFDISKVEYKKEILDVKYALDFEYNREKLRVLGDVNYKDILLVSASTKDFGGMTQFALKDTNFTLEASDIEIQKVLKLSEQKKYLSGLVSLALKGDMNSVAYSLESTKLTTGKKALGFEKEFSLEEEGTFDISKTELKSNYRLNFKQKRQEIALSGLLNYKNSIYFSAKTKLFGAKTTFKYVNDRVALSAIGIDLEELLSFVEKPVYARGEFNLYIAGKVDNLGVYLNAKKIALDKNLTSLDEQINVTLKANYTPKRVNFQTHAKAKTFELNKSKGVYTLANKNLHLEQSLKLLYEGEMIPFFVDVQYRDEVMNVRSPSLGGNLDFELKDKKINLTMKELSIDKIVKITKHQVYVKNGRVNGKVLYDLEAKKATTEVNIKNMTLKGIDLDTTLGAMGLNVFNITNTFLDNDKSKLTQLKHLEIGLDYEREMIHLRDVAFASPKYRIAAIGDIHQNGNITSLDMHILNKYGCSTLDQKLIGSIYDIKLDNKLSTSVDVVRSVPKSLVDKTKRILDFATQTVDKTASFVVKQSHLIDRNITVLSSISNQATDTVSSTIDVVKLECTPVYKGLVKHPLSD